MAYIKAPVKPGDYHLVVSDRETEYNSVMNCFDAYGKKLWTKTCLAKGQHPDYTRRGGDTPPGLYKVGDYTMTKGSESAEIWNAYGKYFFDLISIQEGETPYGRAGVGIHGGGTGSPNPLAPYQQLMPTLGCIRVYNADLENVILPMYKEVDKTGNTIYVSVNQL